MNVKSRGTIVIYLLEIIGWSEVLRCHGKGMEQSKFSNFKTSHVHEYMLNVGG